MKKRLFGYRISDVDMVLDALREENESLNSTIITLQNQIKNNLSEKNAKFIFLEDDFKKLEKDNLQINMEKDELTKQVIALTKEIEAIKLQNNELTSLLSKLQAETMEFDFINEAAVALENYADSKEEDSKE